MFVFVVLGADRFTSTVISLTVVGLILYVITIVVLVVNTGICCAGLKSKDWLYDKIIATGAL